MLKPVLALFFGETLCILGELIAAKNYLWTGAVIGFFGWPLLIWGYWTGYRSGGIWQVTAASIGCILIVEPILVLMIFREAPSRNALIGCLLGAVGLVVANYKDLLAK
jgi:hypothetical protein